MAEPSFILNDGACIPFLGFGTGSMWRQKSDEDVTRAIEAAISKGFVHLDTAQMYENESTIGVAIAASGKPRESFYVTTKLDRAYTQTQTVKEALEESLRKLRLGYVDLFLIHSTRMQYGVGDSLRDAWLEMEKIQRLGLARSIGVSNAGIPELEEILKVGTIVPAVNQMEFHPYFLDVVGPIHEFCKERSIRVTSYGGLTPIVRAKGGPLDPILSSVAMRLGKDTGRTVTEAQVLGKWLFQKGVPFISTTSKEERLDEYLIISSLPTITAEEFDLISQTGSKNFFQYCKAAFSLF